MEYVLVIGKAVIWLLLPLGFAVYQLRAVNRDLAREDTAEREDTVEREAGGDRGSPTKPTTAAAGVSRTGRSPAA
jgi:hypothetical protein